MRLRPLIPCLLAPVLSAQAPLDPVEARVARVKAARDPVVPSFLWLHPGDAKLRGPWEMDEALGRARMSAEFVPGVFEPGEAAAWASRLAWEPGTHWLLLSPDAEPLLSGTGQPEADALLEAMRSRGWRPRRESRAEFLRAHPHHGDAWAETAWEAARFAAHRAMTEQRVSGPAAPKAEPLGQEVLENRPTPPDQDQAQWGEAAKALEGLVKVPGWTGHRSLFTIMVALQVGGAKGSGIMRDPLQRAQAGLEAELLRHPSDPALWEVWGTTDHLVSGAGPGALLDRLEAMPREPWPPLAAAPYLQYAFEQRKDWGGLGALADRAYAEAMSPAIRRSRGGDYAMTVVATWGLARLRALAEQGHEAEAMAVVKALRADAGPSWPAFARGNLGPSLAYYLGGEDALVQALLATPDAPGAAEPPAPAPPVPLRLALLGHPAWERAWGELAARADFDAFAPGEELGWQPLSAEEDRRLRARMGWGPEPHWVLLRGAELLASGTELPASAALADRLRAEGIPYLEQLAAFIKANPDHEEAREARMALLRQRMPQERLEATLIEDAKSTLKAFHPGAISTPPKPGEWAPCPELWAPAARRVLPELEERLSHWPERVALWEAWMDWAQVSADPPDPAGWMARLTIWKSRPAGGAGPLPDAVLEAVSHRLLAASRFKALADWCGAFWESGIREDLARLALVRDRPELGGSMNSGERLDLYTRALLVPYRTALQRLGRAAQLTTFLGEVRAANPEAYLRLTSPRRAPDRGSGRVPPK